MSDTKSGERTVVEAVGSGFAEATALTSGKETMTDSLDTNEDVSLVVVLETGTEGASKEERAAAKLLLVCRAVITAKTTERRKKQNNRTLAA